ncbi:hypothetical protein FB563_1380 [Streptomyces puniciscabiei]|uniref:Type III secretion system (T3SS) SseB-like protein n=1 Tax=Streptomyces puniciscabiei TaxID=164348 RepID=A0A542UBI8_9ACTN|nr:hypothetical protein [Streptomyces puniciscabiei]TQK96437.1 hypothetical protein FB563_1380 [Streptomyces puniciscabiei]
MFENGGAAEQSARIRRSRLYDYVDLPHAEQQETAGPEASEGAGSPEQAATSTDALDAVERRRREFALLLGEFRRTAVLVPLDAENNGLLTVDFGGVRWIYAFSNEHTMARFALARGEAGREWEYQRWLGARLLDAAVPAVGVPCGVALDVGSEDEGALFPPVRGIVPDAVAVDIEARATATGDAR